MSGYSVMFFGLMLAAVGLAVIAELFSTEPWAQALMGLGLGIGAVIVCVLHKRKGTSEGLSGATGALIGVFGAGLSGLMMAEMFGASTLWNAFAFVVFPYLGYVTGCRYRWTPSVETFDRESPKILDTSVIIDGRIVGIAQTGFLEGVYIIPQFVLTELQHIADSSDSVRRVRGRRGLDVLKQLQNMPDRNVQIVEDDFKEIREVDSKIVALGKQRSAKVVTNDFNLNKVAELQGVPVLNINQLCKALEPVVLPGESLNVMVIKEGKESGQGIGYMEDGTMIVVEDGRRWIGKTIGVIVSTILQTSAGRMVFARLREGGAEIMSTKNA